MMRKYGVENANEHFVAFNTICDATQVHFLLSISFRFMEIVHYMTTCYHWPVPPTTLHVI